MYKIFVVDFPAKHGHSQTCISQDYSTESRADFRDVPGRFWGLLAQISGILRACILNFDSGY
jgi:hypothetical protein